MSTMYQNREFIRTPDLSLSDSEDSYSSGDEEMPDRAETDLLLRQAHHYVITEGGNDSPSMYMERIQRIHRSLIQEIARHSYDCDAKLYRRVKQKIDHVLREFEDAVDVDSSIHDYDEMPEYYTAAAEEALYRDGSSPVTPGKRGGKDDFQRTYSYGGPDNHPEIWHKKAPGLPFPETIRMAEWESLRIQWDLATTGNIEGKQPMAGNAVSFNIPQLQHFNHLPQYESGSRFKLPPIDPVEQAKINDFCTVARLTKAVAAHSQSDNSATADGEYEYAPRVFLEKLEVGQQAFSTNRKPSEPRFEVNAPSDLTTVLNDVRKTLNATPTKPRRGSGPGPESEFSHAVKPEKFGGLSVANSSSANDPSHPLTLVIEQPQGENSGISSAIRRIKTATEESIRSSSFPQSPPLQSATPTQPTNRPRSRSCKRPLPSSTQVTVPSSETTTMSKRRKLSVDVSGADAQVATEIESHAKRSRLMKEPARPYTPTVLTQLDSILTPVNTPALTVGSMSSSSVASTPPVVKAKVAGKKQRKIRTKKDFEERVTPERYAEIMAQRKTSSAQGEGAYKERQPASDVT